MSDKARLMLIGVVSLIIGAAAGIVYGMMQVSDVRQQLTAVTQQRDAAVQIAERLRKSSDDAARKYGNELGRLVQAAGAAAQAPGQSSAGATPPADDSTKLIDSARSILVARDNFRGSLDGLRAAMDSDFDALAIEIGNATPNAEAIRQILASLKQNWPDKQKLLDESTRKVLADLGFMQALAAPAPPAAPPPAAAPASK